MPAVPNFLASGWINDRREQPSHEEKQKIKARPGDFSIVKRMLGNLLNQKKQKKPRRIPKYQMPLHN